MHEVGIAKNIIEQIEDQIPAETTVKSIHIRLGANAPVTADALRFGFQIAGARSAFQATELLIEEIPLCVQCEDCSDTTDILHPFLTCSGCGGARMKVISGNELEVVDVRLE